jgi:hypothetical protein
MSDDSVTEVEDNAKPKKAPKGKKRPSDFEIIRTILQRTCERKLPFLFNNIGRPISSLLLCSEKEEGFTYGSSSLAIAFVEFDDPELKEMSEALLKKLHGYTSPNQVIVNLRDQISELAKTKGESIEAEVWNKNDSVWTIRKDVKGMERPLYFCEGIESLYHFQLVNSWIDKYHPLLKTDDPAHLYYPYKHEPKDSYSILRLPTDPHHNHPIGQLHPHGFRNIVTKGIDVLISRMFEPHFPYQIKSEEMIVFITDGVVCQMAHRIIGDGWRMLVVRPNCYFFPSADIKIPHLGNHSL